MKVIKFIVVLCLLLLFVGNSPQVEASNSGQVKYVSSEGDLILRAEPNSKGAKVIMLKKSSKVFVYSTDKNGWSYIKQGSYKGYTKDSYLVVESTPTLQNTPKNALTEKELKRALVEIRAKQKKYPTYSQEYRDALNEENEIIQKLIDLNNRKIKELEKLVGR